MSNAAGALAGLKALEDEAIAAHKRVAEALEGARLLLHGAIVRCYGKEYQIVGLHAHRGLINVSGVVIYQGKAGVRQFDCGDLRDCKIIKYAHEMENPLETHQRKPRPSPIWHPNHRSSGIER